ncbi:MFS transporter [Pseudoclavibacter endophyticus]|uniref:MFS transporter n=1 Tax=Pseudoclavibacter endophyticus TaxID=1778590 RepID=A0A6H9WMM1_9MICO|nr:MFS transporter [Pseudoclavibacter endophyticus]
MPPPPPSDAWDGHERGTRAFRDVRLALLFAGIVTFAQLYAPQAVLPQISAEFEVEASHASLMVSLGTLGVALSAIPWSLVADRFGRVRVMIWSVTSATLLGFITAAMPYFEVALALRLLEGIALGGVPAVALAYLNEEIATRVAPLVAGTYVAGNTIGGLSGRLISAPLGDVLGWRIGLLGVSILAVAATIAFIAVVPQPRGFTPPRRGEIAFARQVTTTLGHVASHLRTPSLIGVYAQPMLLMGGFVAMYNFLGFRLLADPYRLPTWLVGLAFLAYLAGSATSPIAGSLAARFPRKYVLLGCTLVMLAGTALTLAAPVWLILAGLIVMTGGFFAAHSVASGIAGSIPHRGRAQSSAIYNFNYYLGSSVFGFLGGVLYVAFGWIGTVAMVAALIVLALLFALVLIPAATPAAPPAAARPIASPSGVSATKGPAAAP